MGSKAEKRRNLDNSSEECLRKWQEMRGYERDFFFKWERLQYVFMGMKAIK